VPFQEPVDFAHHILPAISRSCDASIMTKLLLLIAALLAVADSPARYAEGQVWEYKSRSQDSGSLVKIQKIEESPVGKIYHVSLIGIHLKANQATVLQHAPVSKETLDASVTRQVADPGTFPDPAEGIAEWRSANGGVFSITLAEIADAVAQMVPPEQPTPVS
jgi:hypothetical protein